MRALVNATTDKCYLNRDSARGYTEGDALGGHDPYSASKACAELVTASYRDSFLAHDDGRGCAVGVASARAGNVIGGGDWGEDRLVPDLVRAATRGARARIRHAGATRPWQHVLEPLAGYLQLGQRLLADPHDAAQAWNFGPGADGELSVAEVVAQLRDAWPAIDVETEHRPQPHEAQRLHLDCGKARERLGWAPVWGAPTLLHRTARWYRRHHEHGAVDSRADLQHYVADARRAALAWAG